jgi:hypothetical protein
MAGGNAQGTFPTEIPSYSTGMMLVINRGDSDSLNTRKNYQLFIGPEGHKAERIVKFENNEVILGPWRYINPPYVNNGSYYLTTEYS